MGYWSSLPSDLNNRIITLPQTDHPEMSSILSELCSIAAISKSKRERDALRVDWEFIGYMLDRLYFWIFMALVIISTTCILASAYLNKEHAIIPHLHQNIQPDNHDDSALYFGTACWKAQDSHVCYSYITLYHYHRKNAFVRSSVRLISHHSRG